MFKLIRSKNYPACNPTIKRFEKSSSYAIPAGTPLCLLEGVVYPCAKGCDVTHMSLNSATLEDKTILCYEVTSDMVFNAPYAGKYDETMIGTKLGFMLNENGLACGAEYDEEHEVILMLDMKAHKNPGDDIELSFIIK